MQSLCCRTLTSRSETVTRLSRDAAEVQRYVSDPLCGFAFTHERVRDIFVDFAQIREPEREARIPITLRRYIARAQGSVNAVAACRRVARCSSGPP